MTMTTSSPFIFTDKFSLYSKQTMTTTYSPFIVGDKFNPSNDLLINHFLKQKLYGNIDEVSRIPELDDIYKLDPWELPFVLGINANEGEGFFFSPLYAKNSYANKGRINRSTKTGSWRAKGQAYHVKSDVTGEVIGDKQIYVHSCNRDGIKWVMHEYSAPNQKALVLCKIIKKLAKTAKTNGQKIKGPYKVQKMKKKAKLPYEKDKIIVLDEDDEEQNTNEKTDPLTYNKDEEDKKTDDSPCNNGETDWLVTMASKNYEADTFLEQANHEMLVPSYLESSPAYNQLDYSPDFSTAQPQNHTEQDQGTSLPEPEDDLFCELEPLWA